MLFHTKWNIILLMELKLMLGELYGGKKDE
jgi:hypothetical protein